MTLPTVRRTLMRALRATSQRAMFVELHCDGQSNQPRPDDNNIRIQLKLV